MCPAQGRSGSRAVDRCEHRDGLIVGSSAVDLGCGSLPVKADGDP